MTILPWIAVAALRGDVPTARLVHDGKSHWEADGSGASRSSCMIDHMSENVKTMVGVDKCNIAQPVCVERPSALMRCWHSLGLAQVRRDGARPGGLGSFASVRGSSHCISGTGSAWRDLTAASALSSGFSQVGCFGDGIRDGPFAGQGLCFALVRIGGHNAGAALSTYLVRWLAEPACDYDQR